MRSILKPRRISRNSRHCADRVTRFFLLLCGLLGHSGLAGDFNVSQLAPGEFVHMGKQVALDAAGHDDIANLGFIVGDKCVAIIDTGGSALTGQRLLAALRVHTALPICYVINTHVHVDHVLGNAAFSEAHPSFVGHAALADAIVNSRQFFATQYGADQVIGPDRLVQPMQEVVLDLGNRRLRLHAWPKAHTDCDLTVLDERSATLWTGDLLFRDRIPALDGSVRGWLAAIDQLAVMKVMRAVPGHGPVARDLAKALVPERRYLQAVVDGVSAELSQGKSVQDAIDRVAVGERPHWLLWDSAHAHTVIHVYEELQWE
jgi:quinoprotein relay system zinc metallohydrolase 2